MVAMCVLENLTEFAAACIPSLTRDDRMLTLVVVAGRWQLPPAGAPLHGSPAPAAVQGEVRLADEYIAGPSAPLLLYEGQGAYTRPGTDLFMHGTAWAPGGRPTAHAAIELRVGLFLKRALVFGDRVWSRALSGVRPSRPTPFQSLPLSYLRCFGGNPERASRAVAEIAEHNPVGRGLHTRDRDAVDQPLPNFEDPAARIESLTDLPRPCGFGPVARHWRPRRDHAGTYDAAWVEQRMPLWPADLDERFFSAAAPGLLAFPHLEGGEPVRIAGMAPAGAHEFSLPRVHLQVRFEANNGMTRKVMVLDAIHFEPDDATFTMVWRASIAADPLSVGAAVVRTLEPWELGR